MKKKAPTPAKYDDAKNPLYFGLDYWLNSPLSITRFWGCCTYNGGLG